MDTWARMIPVLLAGVLLAAKPAADTACAPLAALSGLRDAGVTALSMQPSDGRCLVEVTATNGKALLRQQQMLAALTQHACAAPAEVTVDNLRPSLLLRTPKRCAARSSQDLFVGEGVPWMQPRGKLPRYPREAMEQGLSGRSLLKALIDSHGVVAAVIVETSSGHAVLDEAAVDELHGWHFVRGDAKSTVPALTIVRVPMRYELVE
ncbi:energy transducer TonB [Stenotrophomonas sp. ATs4]|uniref:energy transducer TonB n=1 Tax=Stenotrophomonas sp. ATs4 TaxID=3402766 RepID=UPI003F72FC18